MNSIIKDTVQEWTLSSSITCINCTKILKRKHTTYIYLNYVKMWWLIP